jgi:hypothetical protein
MAYGGEIAYPNDFVMASYRWTTIGANYNPAMGYVPRVGDRITEATFALSPRPDFWNIRQMSFGASYNDYHNLEHRTSETRQIELTPVQLRFNHGERFSYQWTSDQERLFAPWEIRTGITLPVGAYRFHTHRVDFLSSMSKPVSVMLYAGTGSFYSGTQKEAGGGLTWKKNQHLSTSVHIEQNWVRLKEGYFRTRLLVYRLDYSFTPFISLASFVQYDTDSANIGLQSRLRWILKPGNEFFIVLNHAWQQDTLDRFIAAQTQFRVKLNYTFRF